MIDIIFIIAAPILYITGYNKVLFWLIILYALNGFFAIIYATIKPEWYHAKKIEYYLSKGWNPLGDDKDAEMLFSNKIPLSFYITKIILISGLIFIAYNIY